MNCNFVFCYWSYNWEVLDWCVRTVKAPIPSQYFGKEPFTYRPTESSGGNSSSSSSGPATSLPALLTKAPPPQYWTTTSPMAGAWASQPPSSSAPLPKAPPCGGWGGGNSAPPPPAGSVPNPFQTPPPPPTAPPRSSGGFGTGPGPRPSNKDFVCDRTISDKVNYDAEEYSARGIWPCQNDHPLSFLCCLLYDKTTTNQARVASVAVKQLKRPVSRWFSSRPEALVEGECSH